MRKLVSVQKIKSIDPHHNADRLEVARVLGWHVIVAKGEFSVDDKVAYFEVDSFLPGNREVFESFMSRGTKTVTINNIPIEGHVVKTAKLRGIVSQGIIMSLDELDVDKTLTEDTEITDLVGVVKWDTEEVFGEGIIGSFDSRFAPKTDAIRIQSINNFWDELQSTEWIPTVKVDGMSQTIVRDEGVVRYFSRNKELDPKNSPSAELVEKIGLLDALGENMAIQFELAGPGIQKNRLNLSEKRIFVFAVWKNGIKQPRSTWNTNILDHASPVLDNSYLPKNFKTIDELVDHVSELRGTITKDKRDEGVVFHAVNPYDLNDDVLRDIGDNRCFKVISNKWLLKHSL